MQGIRKNESAAGMKFSRESIALLVLVVGVLAVMVFSRFRGPNTHEVRGTLTYIDAVAGRATLEFIDPANGSTRSFSGEVPATCKITINGSPATLADLRSGDIVVARGAIDRRIRDADRKPRIVAEKLDVTRAADSQP